MSDPVADLMRVDFAALDMLCRLHRSRSFTRTAEALGVNQSAVSYTIDKLRRAFGDPLFVKEAGRQVPTPRCEAIAARAALLIESYREMAAPEAFDPARAAAEFTIICNYYERLLLIPGIVAALRAQAPGIRLEMTNASSDGPARLLEGAGDALLGPFIRRESGFAFEDLYEEEYACLLDPSHPAAAGDPDLETYLDFEHVLITYDGSWKSRFLQELEAGGHRLKVALKVPSPAGVAQLVAGSPLVATVPLRLARRIGAGLVIRRCPVPAPFRIGLVWTARNHAAPMHRWVRATLCTAVMAGLEPLHR